MREIEIKNFLKINHFNELSKLNLGNIGDNEIKVSYNKVYKNGQIEADCISKETLKNINDYCHPIASDLLNKLAPEKVKYYEYSEYHIVLTGKNFSFPIHRDTPNKLLSGVVYLHPDKNKGTIIHNKNKTIKKEIEWEKNKALFFSRTDKDSFHSYSSDGVSNRLTLVYNLMTRNIKGVCKEENLNYTYINLREKINPYIYKIYDL